MTDWKPTAKASLPPRWFVRAATPDERPPLWAKWGEYDGEENLKSWSSRRPGETAVVILAPRESQ